MSKLLIHNQKRHGFGGTHVYKIWGGIVKRCENPKCQNYKWYGAKGITVCDEWRLKPESFCTWALANGYKKGLHIDRIDNKGNYEPSNCRFVTAWENTKSGRRKWSNNKTGFTGVSISKHGTFEVYVTVDKKQKYIGVRKTIEDAVKLRNETLKSIDNPELLKS